MDGNAIASPVTDAEFQRVRDTIYDTLASITLQVNKLEKLIHRTKHETRSDVAKGVEQRLTDQSALLFKQLEVAGRLRDVTMVAAMFAMETPGMDTVHAKSALRLRLAVEQVLRNHDKGSNGEVHED